MPARQHDVRGLQIAVYDAVPVRLLERLGHLGPEGDDLPELEAAAFQPRLERLPDDVLHRDAGAAICLGHLVDLANKGVVERGGRLRLALEPLARLRIALQRLGQELEGDLALELGVVGEKHLAHAAFAEGADDAIAGRGAHSSWA